MKKLKIYLMAAMIGLTALAFESCKKGEDDPVISLKTRKDRFTNTWVLVKYEKDGADQNISGSTYTYDVFANNKLTQTIEGAVFGFPVKSVKSGDWEFVNDEEDVRITIEGDVQLYNVQRLASNELWLKRLSGGSTHMYYFETKQ